MLLQLFRNFQNGSLVAKTEAYPYVKGFQLNQNEPLSVWTVQHNMNSYIFLPYIIVDNQQVEAEISIIDENNIEIDFGTPVNGVANFIFFLN